MGNCMETCLPKITTNSRRASCGGDGDHHYTTYPLKQRRPEADEEEVELVQNGVIKEDQASEISEIGDGGGSTVRVKIVLTKEELQWLMMQLKSDGEKKLETMLEEIDKGRKKVVCDNVDGKKCTGWKPSLESITETPELLEMSRSMRF